VLVGGVVVRWNSFSENVTNPLATIAKNSLETGENNNNEILLFI
jgi:hypothetical protein